MLAPTVRQKAEERPARIHGFFYNPGKRSFHIVFVSDDPLKGFEVCSRTLQKFGLKLLSASFTTSPTEGADWSVMVEDGTGIKSEALAAELLSVKDIKYVVMNEDENGMLVDKLHFPLLDPGGERAYIISAETLGKVFDMMRKLFGSGGEILIFEEGEMVGAREVDEMARIFGRGNIVPHLPHMHYLLQITGVGKPEIVSFDLATLTAVFRIHGNVECEGRKTSAPYSRWIKGQLVGFMSALFETPCKAEETKCMAMGDPYCEFVLSPR